MWVSSRTCLWRMLAASPRILAKKELGKVRPRCVSWENTVPTYPKRCDRKSGRFPCATTAAFLPSGTPLALKRLRTCRPATYGPSSTDCRRAPAEQTTRAHTDIGRKMEAKYPPPYKAQLRSECLAETSLAPNTIPVSVQM